MEGDKLSGRNARTRRNRAEPRGIYTEKGDLRVMHRTNSDLFLCVCAHALSMQFNWYCGLFAKGS
jgi:hypothetical protein